jgi:hypothetical protein
MGNNNLKNTNDILIKVDQNNLIYIDPNSVVSNGLAVPRSVEPENLVMYVNLEADLVPRTTLISSDNENTLLSIAKGTLNFMKNPNGRDFDTKWTDAYTDVRERSSSSTSSKTDPTDKTFIQNDPSGQSFGIDNISIKVAGANFIPTVTIKFIDVRGKTLFDSPANSPYAAFFHLPWPIFYLTVKGYYGKAIKYRLHMIKFNSRYNPTYGNFEVDATFIGSTYAYLADISLEAVLNAPYFYISENASITKFNEETGYYDVNVSKTTKGYRMLKSVYQEYINMGLLPPDFPVRTLREVIIIAGRLNKILEREIFDKVVNPKVLSGVKEYEDQIQNFATTIETWRRDNIGSTPDYFTTLEKRSSTGEYIRWYKMITKNKDTLINITGSTITATLEFKITNYINYLENNQTFGVKRDVKLILNDKFKIKVISVDALKTISNFYRFKDGTYGIDVDGIIDIIVAIERDFVEQRNKLETDIEGRMNEIVRNKNIGIGFEPTIRNIVGVLLANAETYVRLMKDVHEKAFNMGHERKKLLENVLTDSVGESIYPWPEIKAKNSGGKEIVLVYPGGKEMGDKLHASDTNLWPEVDFVENFYEVATKKADNLANREGNPENINYIFSTAINMAKKDIGVLTNISGYLPYGDKSPSSILYEIYERAKYTTALNPFSNDVMVELADVEFDNLQNQVSEDIDLVDTLKAYVTNYGNLLYYMGAFSTFDRYPYYQDQLPTVPYIKDVISEDYSVNKYQLNYNNPTNKDLYPKLSQFLSNYKPESYRINIYPFNSSTYLGYLGQKSFTENNLHLNKLLIVNAPDDFIASPINPQIFVKDGYIHNFFQYMINIGGASKQILNTPYFHKQLYNDFTQAQSSGKYVGSAYLFLNSLPFKDLDDKITYAGGVIETDTLISTLFREIGATHYIPYHMMLKWGSIYHRYKRMLDPISPIDIINNVTNPIDGNLYFDNNLNRVYTGSTNPGVDVIDRTNLNDVGIHPFYDTVFHQIANGYAFFDFMAGPTGYSQTISSDITKIYYRETVGGYAWSTFVDESKFTTTDNRYALLPSNGYNDMNMNDFINAEQENFRIIWNVGTEYSSKYVYYSGYTFPSSYEYFKLTDGTYSLSTNYRKVIDLIATFKPDILDIFEQAFLDFASEKINAEIPYKPYDVKYSNFQDLLKDIISVAKDNTDPTDINGLFNRVKEKQSANLADITFNMLSTDSLVKVSLANPREIDNYLLGQFTGTGFTMNVFDPSQIGYNADNITLYLGEDIDGYYQDFFSIINIELSEENIKQFRPLIYMYAGLRANGQNPTKEGFISYVKDNITSPLPFKIDSTSIAGPDKRLEVFLDQLIRRIQKDLKSEEVQNISKKRGYSDDIIKLELYNMFKSFNDKWTSGNSIGQRTLMEEFLFLDKANRDIGSSVYIDMEKLMRLTDKGNEKINLFSALSLLVQDTGFDIRALPAYVNFYGTNFSSTKKITPSKTVAENMFGAFLNIDYVDSSPKIILQYIGPTSKHLEMSDIDFKYKYKNDGFNIGDVNNNPIIISSDVFTRMDFAKSNKVVAFEVSFGDQNQSIFKGVELDQTSIKNTSESFIVLDRLGRSESGSSTAQIDVGLFDIYRQSSYQCQVTAMGNVMIQPTMYFYLKNIPLFRGSYWITEVTHTIRTTGIETSFKGSRIPLQSLPNPTDSFLASYRSLFDRMVKRAEVKVKEVTLTATTINDISVSSDAGNFTYNMGNVTIPGEKIVNPPGVTPYGVPYNGFDGEKYIQKVSYINENVKWLRAIAVQMDGKFYKIDSGTTMTILTSLTYGGIDAPHPIVWNDIKDLGDKQDFYVTKFNMSRITPDYLITHFHSTVFLNPLNKKPVTVVTNMNNANKTYMGPVSVGPAVSFDILQTLPFKPMGVGIGLSGSLMRKLGLLDGQVVYFNMLE